MLVEFLQHKPITPYSPLGYAKFVEGLTDKQWNHERRMYSQTLFPIAENIGQERRFFHRGTLGYLEHCWANHYGAVLTPDMVWYDILGELAVIIKADPERYRHLFSTSQEKQEIIVQSDSMTVLPLDLVVHTLKSVVPTDVDQFLPEFSTTTDRARSARYAAFCDAVSPYYNYSMFACGIPFIDVRGTAEDWLRMFTIWPKIAKLMGFDRPVSNSLSAAGWSKTVEQLLMHLAKYVGGQAGGMSPAIDFWKNMFVLTPCGSGSETEVDGWYASLYRKIPQLKKAENYQPHVSSVEYTQLNTQQKYVMKQGLFSSWLVGDTDRATLEPQFGQVIMHKRPMETIPEGPMRLETSSWKPQSPDEREWLRCEKLAEMLVW